MDNDTLIQTIVDKMQNRVGGALTAESMSLLNTDEITLWGFSILHEEIMDGGFVQLIHNGYGPFFFENPFAKAMRLYGLHDLSKLLYKARTLYELHGAAIAKECTDEEFMALYELYPDFDDLDDEFITNEEMYMAGMAEYIKNHLDSFSITE